jgi:hypothetical protein
MFLMTPNALKKYINKNIVTDATPLEDPKGTQRIGGVAIVQARGERI